MNYNKSKDINKRNILKLEGYRLLKNKIFIYGFIFEILLLIFSAIGLPTEITNSKDLFLSSYFNISLNFRYIFVSIVISELISKDINKGLFNTYVAVGNNKVKILLAKITVIVFYAIMLNLFSAILYGAIYIFLNTNLDGLWYSLVYNSINCITLISFIIFIIFIDLLTMTSYITIIFSFTIVFFSQLLPISIAKFILPNYNNIILVTNLADQNSIITMIGVIATYFILFLFFNIYYIKKIDL